MVDFGATAAALLYTAAVIMLFGLRSWQQKRTTGSSGFRGLRGLDAGWPARVAAAGFVVAVLAGLVSPVLARLHVLPVLGRAEDWDAGGWVWIGLAVTAAGIVLAIVAQQTMGDSWRIGVDPDEQTELITAGAFRLVRNPIFTAMIMVQFGTAIMCQTWLATVGVAVLVMSCELQTRRVEEPYLLDTHGVGYRDYASRTGRFLPYLGRLDLTTSTTADGVA